MGLTHDIDTILKSAERFSDIANIQYLLIGGGGKFNSVVEFVSKNKLNNVKKGINIIVNNNIDMKYTLPSLCILNCI